ncbi:protein kinase [Haloferula sp. BvORR071]|uniref:protein kinase domain-containing protein n=1 Tax=Haloferula sp. BvORR071 TaxID=1396141 RepID=UPI000695E777|nr:protein kinase [Haloferula sp. BvORR071]
MSAESFEAPSFELLAELLPAYDFEAFIAQGGMGAVYKARQRSLDRDVAIKILPRELGEDPEFHLSFETEAKAMARLNHPNLIGVYDYGDVDGMPYIVMEFVNGKSLFHSAYNMQVDPVQAVTIVKGICDGLAHAHENGVIHRDIKPANILLNEKVVPKIGDFGLARPADVAGSGVVMGTPGYVAPEVLTHPEKADRRSDLFALGVVLYELLIGRCPPFNNYQPPASTVCGCDVALDRICDKAMHPNAALRYQSAEQMSADLEAWLRKASAPAAAAHAYAPPAGPPRRPAGMRKVAGAAPARQQYSASNSGGSGGMAKGLLMLAAAIAIGAIGWSKFQAGEKAKEEAAAKAQADARKQAADQVAKDASTKTPDKATTGKGGLPNANDATASGGSLESLEKLRWDLVAGKREKMPEGTVKLGATHFMVIPTPMTWLAAQAFAEKHGAHLFVAEDQKQLEQVSMLTPNAEAGAEAGLWIGAGSAADSWSWIDGAAWHLDEKPEGKGAYAIVDAKSALHARDAADRYPFAIQWEADGMNSAALPLVLGRVGKSIEDGNPVFPPGTIEYKGHYVFLAMGTSSIQKAGEMAGKAGGHLIFLDTEEKTQWLADHLPQDGIKDGLWAGAVRQDDKWVWMNGEALDYTRWRDEAQPTNHGGVLKIGPNGDWLSAYSGDPASGFVVEWDVAPGDDKADPGKPENVPAAVADLENKAKELLAKLVQDRDKDLATNAKTFAWDLDGWHKNLSKNEQSTWNRDISMLKALVKDNRVPNGVDAASGIRLSQNMAKISEYSLAKQKTIDAAFEGKADKIRTPYATRMADLAKKLASDGDAKGAKVAEGRAADAANLKEWLDAMLGGSSKEESANNRTASTTISSLSSGKSGAVGNTSMAGRWVWMSKDIVTIEESGKAQAEKAGHKGRWVAVDGDDARYTFTWQNGEFTETLTLSSDGMEMTGKNNVGDKVTAWRIVKGKDPIVDGWAWNPSYCVFRDDHTVRKGNDSGTWTLTSTDDEVRSYTVKWKSGYEDKITLKGDDDSFKGTNNNGETINGKRIPRG